MEGQKTELKMIRMSEVESQEVKWLWYPFIPYGKLTIIQGDPGDGKTTLVLNIAAKLSKGESLDSDMKAADKVFRVIEQVVDAGTLRVVTRFGSQFMPVFRIGRTVAEPIGIENGTELETEVGTVAECRYWGEAESRFPIGIFRACEGAAGWGGHTVGTAGFGTGTACSGSQQDCRCEQQFHDRLVSSFSRHPSVGLRP